MDKIFYFQYFLYCSEIVSMKNNSGRFVFTLNGENEKSEKKTNTKDQIKIEEKTENTKKDIIQKKVK